MTADAGERYAGLTVARGARARRRRPRASRAASARARTTSTRSRTASARASAIEPLISLQWFMRMDELAAPGDRRRARRPRAHPPAVAAQALPRLAVGDPPVVHLAPAVVGPPDPGLVPRRRDVRAASSRPRARAGSRTPTCSTRGSRSALWPFATLGWPDDTPELRAFYPTDVLSTARDILFLWVARMVMMGLRFAGDIPFSDVYVHSIIQAPDGRRMSKSLGTGIDPLDLIDGGPRPPVFAARRRLPGLRRRRRALRPAGDVLDAGRALQRGEDRAGPGARQQALQRDALRARCASAATRAPAPRPSRARSRTAGSSRACRRSRPRRRRASTASTSRRPRSGSTTSSTASCATGTSSSSSRASATTPTPTSARRSARRSCTCCARRSRSRTRSSRSSPRSCGTCSATREAEGLLAAGRLPEPDDALRDPDAEARWGARSTRSSALRSWRDSVGVKAGRDRARRAARRRLRGRRPRASPASRASTCADGDGDGDAEPVATVAIPGGAVDVLAVRRRRPRRRRPPPRASSARRSRARSRAPTASSPTRASSPRRPPPSSTAERDKLERLREELAALSRSSRDARARRPRRGAAAAGRRRRRALAARRSSSSACASAWTACAG